MNNGDMPANPIVASNGFVSDPNSGALDGTLAGLTKREMFSMAADVSGFVIKDKKFLQEFIDRDVDLDDPEDLIIAGAQAVAKYKVIMADMLLEALSKDHSE